MIFSGQSGLPVPSTILDYWPPQYKWKELKTLILVVWSKALAYRSQCLLGTDLDGRKFDSLFAEECVLWLPPPSHNWLPWYNWKNFAWEWYIKHHFFTPPPPICIHSNREYSMYQDFYTYTIICIIYIYNIILDFILYGIYFLTFPLFSAWFITSGIVSSVPVLFGLCFTVCVCYYSMLLLKTLTIISSTVVMLFI